MKMYISTHLIYFYDIEFICLIQIEYQNESYYKITIDFIYFYDIEFICLIQIEYQNESYYKITIDYCINIFMILIIYLYYLANTV